jgi:hypothetical protein
VGARAVAKGADGALRAPGVAAQGLHVRVGRRVLLAQPRKVPALSVWGCLLFVFFVFVLCEKRGAHTKNCRTTTHNTTQHTNNKKN